MAQQKDIEMYDSCKQFQVFVRIVTGRQFKTFTLNVCVDDCVGDIANKLSLKIGVSAKLITFSYESRMLYPNKTVKSYHIGRESTLNATCGNFASFPVSVSNEQTMTKINQIDTLIHGLKNGFVTKILRSSSISDLNIIHNEIDNNYNKQMCNLNNDKLNCLNDIFTNNAMQQQSVELNIEAAQKDVFEIDECLFKLNTKIYHYQQLIVDLQQQKNKTNQSRIAKKKELEIVKKSNTDFKTESISLKNKINTIQKDLETNHALILFDCVQNELRKYENKYSKWNSNDIIEWINLIENGQFNNNIKLIEAIGKVSICGDSLNDLRNDSLLQLVGLNLMERKLILKNIDRVLSKGDLNGANSNICTVCVSKRINSVFIPCGHQSCCFQCYETQKERFVNCPICREGILKTVKTFMNGF